MSEQTKIKHSPAVEGKKHHKVRWIVLAVLLVIVAAVAAWYLIRFEFNRRTLKRPRARQRSQNWRRLRTKTRMSPRLSSCLRKTTT